MKRTVALVCGVLAGRGWAMEYHVSTGGNDAGDGTREAPFRTVQRAADAVQPGDVVTVHAGVYRERVDPPRGGDSEARRITYRAAPGERVVLTGSESVKGWTRVTNDTWKATVPNRVFGAFNPFADLIRGDWCSNPRGCHTGAVYLDGDWLQEAAKLDELLDPERAPSYERRGGCLLNVAWLRPSRGAQVPAAQFAAQQGVKRAPCSEGGECLGWLENGDWVRYDGVDCGAGSESIEFRAASVTGGGVIEVRDGSPGGALLGTCAVADTGDWQVWRSFTATIKPVSGRRALCLVFRPPFAAGERPPLWFAAVDATGTTVWAQFRGADPNGRQVEINVRQTVFTPSKAGVDYLAVRGFELRNAAAPWAPPTAAQLGIVTAYWCKGWLIESNRVCYSPCCGIALGKYGDAFDNTSADTAEGYVGTIDRALSNGWNKATVGSHVVRGNTISHCEQTGVVGSLGCSFSTVADNDIHDIHVRNLYGGAEMAGIKFHGAIDVAIRHNHIYRCGNAAGLWLDWMAQGCRVTGNLMHDNSQDVFLEMQHGPIMVDNNLFLSPRAFSLNALGVAFVHNLIAGQVNSSRGDKRSTPYQKAHATALGGMHACPDGDSGDHRFCNNLFVAPCKLASLDRAALPCLASGNVYTKGTQPLACDAGALAQPEVAPNVQLAERTDGWYVTLSAGARWRGEAKRRLATTASLGRAHVTGCAYESPDGSALAIDADYFGSRRDGLGPMPGPFETVGDGTSTFKVW